MLPDLHAALRSLTKSPAITLLAILSIAFGIGLTTGTFAIADAMLLRPFAVERPGELFSLASRSDEGHWIDYGWPDYQDLVAAGAPYLDLAAYSRRGTMLTRGDESELILTHATSRNYFSLLGVRAALGRASVHDADNRPSVVLGHRIWQSRFGGDREIVGKTVLLRMTPFVVAGVMPAEFTGLLRGVEADAWVSSESWFDVLGSRDERLSRDGQFEFVARLKPGTSPGHAAAILDGAIRGPGKHRPAPAGATGTYLEPRFAPGWTATLIFGGGLLLLLGLVLLISCFNVAQLRLAQAESRKREIGLRLALGAGRWRLAQMLLAETALLAALGAGLGLALALWVIDLGAQLLSGGSPYVNYNIGLDRRVLIFTAAASLLAVLLSGLAPARHAVRLDIAAVVRSERPGARSGRLWLRDAFLSVQVACSVALFGGALLFLQSFRNAASIRPGIDAAKELAIFRVAPGAHSSALWAEQAAERLAAFPGVLAVTYARRLPLSGSGGGATARVEAPGQSPLAVRFNNVAGNYFAMTGIRMLAGRGIDGRDVAGTEPVVVVSRMFARQFFADCEAVGQWVSINGTRRRIVGVVEDTPSIRLREDPAPYLYFPFAQRPSSELALIVETASASSNLIAPLRAELKRFDPAAIVTSTTTLRQHLQQALAFERAMASLSSLLGTVGMLLTASGLFGVVQYLVSRRTREIGLRIALGAGTGQIRRLVLGQSLAVAAAGLPLGFLLLWALGRYVKTMLLGVSPLHPEAYVLSAAAVLVITVAATWLPAARAARVGPAEALRNE